MIYRLCSPVLGNRMADLHNIYWKPRSCLEVRFGHRKFFLSCLAIPHCRDQSRLPFLNELVFQLAKDDHKGVN